MTIGLAFAAGVVQGVDGPGDPTIMRPGKIGVASRDIARDKHTVFEASLRRNGAFDDNRNSSAASNDGQSALRQREKQCFG